MERVKKVAKLGKDTSIARNNFSNGRDIVRPSSVRLGVIVLHVLLKGLVRRVPMVFLRRNAHRAAIYIPAKDMLHLPSSTAVTANKDRLFIIQIVTACIRPVSNIVLIPCRIKLNWARRKTA